MQIGTNMKQQKRDQYIDQLRESICEVVFIKMNGDPRTMRCTLNATFLPEIKTSSSPQKQSDDSVIRAWDVDAGGLDRSRLIMSVTSPH